MLEDRGAESRNVVEASINAVRKCDVYLGVFGGEYSETSIKEYKEAIRKRKPGLTYVKDMRNRDSKLARFIREDLSYQFKYHNFRSNKGLLRQVKRDLESLLFEFLEAGLETVQQRKDEAKVAEENADRLAEIAGAGKNELQGIFSEAYSAFENGMYMAAITTTATAIEVALRKRLQELSPETQAEHRKLTLGMLVERLHRNGWISSYDAGTLREVQILRNKAVHEGQVPSKLEVERALKWGEHFLNILTESSV